MSSRRIAVLVFVCLLVLMGVRGGSAWPSPEEKSPFAAADAEILSEIREHSEAMANLEYLSDSIGPRVTGSPQLKQANEWTRDKFAQYGTTNAHLESWTIAHSWARGMARARMVSPAEHPLTIAAAGWSPSTPGVVQGPVIYFDAKKKEDFAKFHGKLKGAIVIYQEPASLSPPKPDDPNAVMLRPMQQPPARIGEPPVPSPFAAQVAMGRARTEFFKEEGVAAVLRDSEKPHGLLNMTGVGGEKFDIGALPNAFITGEGYRMIWRLLKHGPVQVELEITNSFSDKPVDVYNTVAEIRGSEKPDEVVLLGAHLDSWDLGTGSTDNGTGAIAVLEAARILKAVGARPSRTIRFVLFTGEEEGLLGSQAYVEAHQKEMPKIQAVLVLDNGTGRITGIGLQGRNELHAMWTALFTPLADLGPLVAKSEIKTGTDHLSFLPQGVPAFN